MTVPLYQVDAFTGRPFSGNPAAVCLLAGPAEPEWMQQVAAEMNLSETAFLARRADGWLLRWFTPSIEVELCGHATLAGAHVLWEADLLDAGETARFHTRSGLLTARRREGWIEMDFPALPAAPCPVPRGLAEALGAEPAWVGRGGGNLLVELPSPQDVAAVQPDFKALRALEAGVIVTARGGGGDCDFVSRYFAPFYGVDEDPVTGSAHCTSGPYWARKLDKPELVAHQVSARGGVVRVAAAGDRVRLGGEAVTVFTGQLRAARTPRDSAPAARC